MGASTNALAVDRADSGVMRNQPSATRTMVVSLACDIGLPIAAYAIAELCGFDTYISLLAGTVAAGARMVWTAVRDRRLDVFAAFLLILFGAGFLLSFWTGDVRFLLAKDATTSATAGLVFVGSCLIKRPLAYHAAKRFAGAAGAKNFLATADTPAMRKRWYRVSLVWGVGLITDAVLRVAAIYLLPLNTAAVVVQVLTIATYSLLIGWTVHSAKTALPTAKPTAPVAASGYRG